MSLAAASYINEALGDVFTEGRRGLKRQQRGGSGESSGGGGGCGS